MMNQKSDNQELLHLGVKTLNSSLKGWIKVEITSLGIRYLCFGTKVKTVSRHKNIQSVKILDGPFRDHVARINLEEFANFTNIEISLREVPARVEFDSVNKLIKICGLGEFSAETNSSIPKGVYWLEIPSHPHTKTPRAYLNEANGGSIFAETWFRIVPMNGNISESFLHFGKLSRGCIVVKQLKSWNIIYNYLIRCRSGRLNVGIIKII